MMTGQRFYTTGYDEVAHAENCDTGERTVVLCNNSSHYLVAVRDDPDTLDAVLIASYPYYDQPDCIRFVYSQALTKMMEHALNER
jgi:hypothetical protein